METKKRALGKGLEQLFNNENLDLNSFEKTVYETATNEEIMQYGNHIDEETGVPVTALWKERDKRLKQLMEQYKPKYLLHGHVHPEYNPYTGQKPVRELEYKGTKVINVYERFVLDLPDVEVPDKHKGQIIWKTKHKD